MIIKYVVFVIFACLLAACSPKKQTQESNFENYTVLTECNSEGTCEFSVIKDKSLSIKTSDNSGLYYQLTNAPGNVVIKYTYNKKTNPAYADGTYSEEFLFETDGNFSNLKSNTPDIKKIYGLHCFCKGKAGYYRVGNAVIKYKNNILSFTLPAVAERQVVTEVKVAFK